MFLLDGRVGSWFQMVGQGIIQGYSFYGVDMFCRILLGHVGERILFPNCDLYLNMFFTQKVVGPTWVHIRG